MRRLNCLNSPIPESIQGIANLNMMIQQCMIQKGGNHIHRRSRIRMYGVIKIITM